MNLKLRAKRATPLTDAFLEDLKNRMAKLNPPLKKTELGLLLGNVPKQMINSWLKSKAKRPCSESLLKLQELVRKNFMRMFL